MSVDDVVVVGGGAGGLSAALVLARARRRVVVVDDGEPRNAPAAHVHGFLSREGVAPEELLRLGRDEVRRYGGEVRRGRVERIEPGFAVRLAGGGTLRARHVVVATGLLDALPLLPGVTERWGRDVLHCPYCHGYEVRDAAIAVVASLPGSSHQALTVRQWSGDVVFFPHEWELPDGERSRLVDRGIRVVDGEVGGLVVADDRITGVRLADGRVVPRDVVFVSPECVRRDAPLAGLGCEVDDEGWVVSDADGRTSVPGVWVAGNVADPTAQVIDAAAAGARAGMAINNELVEAGPA